MKPIPAHGIASGANARTSVASGVGAGHTADDPRLEDGDHDDGLEPRVEPDELGRLDDEAGLLEGLADRRFVDGLVDLEEAARLGPGADRRLDPAPDEHDLAGRGHRQRRRDEARVDVGDVATARTGQPVAVLASSGP